MRIVFLFLAAVSLVTACGPMPGDAGKATLRQVMADTIEPQSALVQDMTFELYDDNGELDPRRLSTSHWDVIEQAGKDLEKAGRALARAETHKVTAEGVALQGADAEGAATPEEIAAWIEADHDGFAAEARKLAGAAQNIVVAAQLRDAIELDAAALSLGDTCSSCHNQFWYRQSE
ncbi:cytochrome c [Henriciella litoralis]|uniref:cytochrome c n=1 Tax=Henriciella litoralis TaxID=568102 RepID=UPI00146C78EA|nr:cytochrome c [Henriciella litoralis]